MASKMIDIGSVGWEHDDGFYPDDLPSDWRLAYYANAHRAVWVPESAWLGEALPDTAVWREDVNEAFGFVVVLDERHAAIPGLGDALRLLGEQLRAVVAPLAVFEAVVADGGAPSAPRVDPAAVWSPGGGGVDAAFVGRVTQADLDSPRAMRMVLETFAAEGEGERLFLFVDGSFGALDDLRTIGRLMGLC